MNLIINISIKMKIKIFNHYHHQYQSQSFVLLLFILLVINGSSIHAQQQKPSQQSLSQSPESSSTSKNNSDNNTIITEEELVKLSRMLKINPKRLPVLRKLSRKLDSLVNRVNTNQGHIRPEMFVHEFLPDPLPVKDIEVKNDEFIGYYTGTFTNVQLHGISGVVVDSIRANIGTLTAKVRENFLTQSFNNNNNNISIIRLYYMFLMYI